jgi:hypothetical protein
VGEQFISMIGMLFKEDAILINAQSNANATQFSHTWTVHINDVNMLLIYSTHRGLMHALLGIGHIILFSMKFYFHPG